MARFVLLLILFWIAFELAQRQLRKWADGRRLSRADRREAGTLREGELVRCASCGVHVPRAPEGEGADRAGAGRDLCDVCLRGETEGPS